MALGGYIMRLLIFILALQQIEIRTRDRNDSHLSLSQSNLVNLFMGRQIESSWYLKHPQAKAVKSTRRNDSLPLFVVGGKLVCILKYSLAAIILQRSGDVAVLLNPGPINAANSSSLSSSSTSNPLQIWPEPPCRSCQSTITWDVESQFCSYCDSYYHTACVNIDQPINVEFLDWICDECALSSSEYSLCSAADNVSFESISSESTTEDPDISTINQPSSTNYSYLKIPLPAKGLRFGQWNVNHLTNSKFEQIKILLTNNASTIDILFLTETFLKPTNCDSLYEIPGFTFLRKDRLNKAGGGVAVYCNNTLTFNRRLDLERDSVEILWLEICPYKSKRSLLVSGCYRPPSNTMYDDKAFDESIETAYLTNKEIILTGDFNINFISTEFKKHYLSKSLTNMHFTQLVTEVTRPISGTCLDHIYTNKSQHITAVLVKNYALSDHLPTFATRKYFKQSKTSNLHESITYRNIKKIDEASFNYTLANSPWDTAFIFDDINDALDSWENIFFQAVDLHAATKQKRVAKVIQPHWINSDILEQLKIRDNLLSKARKTKTNSTDAWKQYRGARNLASNMIEKAKRSYFKSSIQNNKGNAKSIWKLIKSLGGGKPTRLPEFLLDEYNKVINKSCEIAEVFNIHFTTIASKIKSSLSSVNNFDLNTLNQFVSSKMSSNTINFSLSPITPEIVQTYVTTISPNKATGTDGISVQLLKMGIKELAPSISRLINMSFTNNQFPVRWKTARVSALFKTGDLSDVNNYRPISVLPLLSKIIERHVYDCLFEYLTINNLIYSNQSGFRKKFSTETAVAYIVDSLLFNLDKNCINGMVLVDYKKAFDMVDHCILLEKLCAYKLNPNSLQWFKSYLSDRKQYVTFKGHSSTSRIITDGVPQGSILGPLLFLIFINDLPLHINTQVDLFADDTTLLSSTDYNDMNELRNKLSVEVSNVQNWAISNKLPLNCTKTKSILISGKRLKAKLATENQVLNIEMNDVPLEQVHQVKLLGFIIDEDLSFNTHVESLATKLSKRIGILKSIKSYLPRAERILFYNAMIKPLFLYCGSTWTNCSKNNIVKIFKLQKRCARVILNAQPCHSTVDLFNRLGWIPFYVESDIRKCILVYKRTVNDTPEYLNKLLKLNSQQHSRITRSAHLSLITPAYTRVTEAGRTFSVTAIGLWNKLPLSLRSSGSLNFFKQSLYRCFRDYQQEFKQFTSFPDFKF